MISRRPTLDAALRELKIPEKLPWPLPAAHLTDARQFAGIVKAGSLTPRHCGVFGEDLVYLFYGGVFYRTSYKPTKHATYFPLAFLFRPIVLNCADRFYPFDTGGMNSNRFGDWKATLDPFRERCRVAGGSYEIPAKMVYHFFGTNKEYLFGDPSPDRGDLPEPFPDLRNFLADDLTRYDADQRCRMIEAHLTLPLALEDVIWVGFPAGFDDVFAQLCERLRPYVPQYFRYQSYPFPRPNELAAILQDHAYEEVVRRYMGYPAP